MEGIIQVIGAKGFIGRHVFEILTDSGAPVIGMSRSSLRFANLPSSIQEIDGFNYNYVGDQVRVFDGVSTVVFCAGLAHIQEPTAAELKAFEQVNAALPVKYAEAAIAAGAQRFIYISSIGVHGDFAVEAFSESSMFCPCDEYSRSKLFAEEKLKELLNGSGVDLIIIRPPMVYGPKAPGNYSRLVPLVERGFPLPFGALDNPRSFISIQNLVSFLIRCVDHPNAAGQTFVVSDNDDTTTCDFVREIAKAQGCAVKLLPVPRWLFVAGLTLLGKGKIARKLCAPLTVDCSHAMKTLDWHPPYSLREGLRMSFENE